MMGESHVILGGVATAAVLLAVGYDPAEQGIVNFSLVVGFGALVALLPDIDSPNTTLRRLFGLGSRQARSNLKQWRRKRMAFNLLNLIRWLIALFLDGVAKLLPHRGPTHWLVVAAGLGFLVYWLTVRQGWPSFVWQVFVVGYATHLLADSCTKAGVKLLAPFYNRRIGLPFFFLRIRTGSWQEEITLLILLLPFIVWLAYLYVT